MTDYIGELEWVRPKPWKLDWELRRGGEVLGTLSSPRLFGTELSGTIGTEQFVMNRGGLRRPGAAIRKPGSRDDLALLVFDAIGTGTITFPDSSSYRLLRSGPSEEWTMYQEGKGELFKVKRDTKSKYPNGKVSVDITDPHLDVLLLLSWFVISTCEC
jgi:hypothetical protein